MELPRNAFKRALAEGRPQIGLWTTLASSYVLEVVAGAGFDWLVLDTEHAPSDLAEILAQLQCLAAYPATSPVVRVPWNDLVAIKRYLDIGALTLLVPFVNSAEEARAAVAAMRYAPEGLRGLASGTRANRFARVPDYHRRAAEELCLLVQVETRQALDSLEEIAAVPGVDGVFIGPADLHASLGHPGEQSNPAVLPLIDQAIGRIRAAGKAAGILTSAEANARRWLDLGANFVAVGSDVGILARGADALAAKFRP